MRTKQISFNEFSGSDCNWTQVRLPAAMNINTWEAGAAVKKSGLLGVSHLEDGGLTSQSPSPLLSGEQNKKIKGKGWQSSLCRWAQSIPIRQMMLLCASPWFSYLGSMSSWLNGWRSANILELGCLKIGFYTFWSYFLGFLYTHAIHLQATY